MKRLFDFSLAFIAFIPLFPILLILIIIVRLTSKGNAIYWSDRVGINNSIFKMPKLRTMYIDTPAVATHLLQSSTSHITPIGSFLRKTSLDEIPQLWSILKGDMSFVGPRPALFNQDDLIEERTKLGIEKIRPGLTGWAQINGRDNISIPKKVSLDEHYLKNRSFRLDIYIIVVTFLKVALSKEISH
jgi:O-antigen biosynthesis protein WbqP